MTWTELHEACEHQDGCKITRIAHQHCKEALETDDHGWIPLHVLCCGNPDLNAVKALVTACPQSLAGQDVKGDTPLHVACSFPRTDTHLVELLVDVFPAALSMTNHEGLMPLHVACRHDPHNFELIKLLVKRYPCALEKGIKIGTPCPDKEGHTGGSTAELYRRPHDRVPFDPSFGIATKSSTDFHFEETRGQVRDGAYPLHMAIVHGAPLPTIELLANEAPNVLLQTNKYGETPLHLALKNHSDDETIMLMIRLAPDAVSMVDKENGNTPLQTAVMEGCSLDILHCIVDSGPRGIKSFRNKDGLTAHELAVSRNVFPRQSIRFIEFSSG